MSPLDPIRDLLGQYTWACQELYPWFLPTVFFILGACIGSFLNVVIYRMPRGISVHSPRRSFCPHCSALIPAYLNLPIISWLWLRGRSACCGKPISPRYCIVELLTALLFLAVSLTQETDAITQLCICLWFATMLAILCIDWETMIVLRRLCLSAVIFALGASLLDPYAVCGHIGLDTTLGLTGAPAVAAGAAAGFLLVGGMALLGMLLFGLRRKRFTQRVDWSLRQADDGEDILLTIGSEKLLLSQLFREAHDRLTLHAATLEQAPTPSTRTDIILTPEALLIGNKRILLEDHDSLTGSCTGYFSKRSAMGRGDAWIALAIGSLTGIDGAVVALVGGSFIGLLAAICARRGFGTAIPFGPCLITAAFLWYFLGQSILTHL